MDDGRLVVETPEQIGIEFELAGAGSRFLAELIDLLCMLVFLVVAFVAALASLKGRGQVLRQMGDNAARSESWLSGLGATATIVILLSLFVVIWGYYIICEMAMSGASPGKRALGLRVIRDSGLPIGFANSLLRNLVRVVDFLPWGYGVGLVTMFASPRSQRLGDLAAGTLVVRVAPPAAALPGPDVDPGVGGAGGARLSARERALIGQLFARTSLLPDARARLAAAIAAPLRLRLAGGAGSSAPVVGDEDWLRELLAADAAARPLPRPPP